MKAIVVDSDSLLKQVFFRNQENLQESNFSLPFAFLMEVSSILKIIEFPWGILVFVWDGGYRARKTIYPQYKEKRQKIDEELYSILEKSKEDLIVEIILSLPSIQFVEVGVEADDIISGVVRKLDAGIILTSDKDLYQLVSPHIEVFNVRHFERVHLENFRERTGFDTPNDFLLARCLHGDTSDNIDGITGIGTKTSKEIVKKYKTLDEIISSVKIIKNLFPRAKNLEDELEKLKLNYRLMDLAKPMIDEFPPAYPGKYDFQNLLNYFGEKRREFLLEILEPIIYHEYPGA